MSCGKFVAELCYDSGLSNVRKWSLMPLVLAKWTLAVFHCQLFASKKSRVSLELNGILLYFIVGRAAFSGQASDLISLLSTNLRQGLQGKGLQEV